MTAVSVTGGNDLACAIKLDSPVGEMILQHACGIWASPQFDAI